MALSKDLKNHINNTTVLSLLCNCAFTAMKKQINCCPHFSESVLQLAVCKCSVIVQCLQYHCETKTCWMAFIKRRLLFFFFPILSKTRDPLIFGTKYWDIGTFCLVRRIPDDKVLRWTQYIWPRRNDLSHKITNVKYKLLRVRSPNLGHLWLG